MSTSGNSLAEGKGRATSKHSVPSTQHGEIGMMPHVFKGCSRRSLLVSSTFQADAKTLEARLPHQPGFRSGDIGLTNLFHHVLCYRTVDP